MIGLLIAMGGYLITLFSYALGALGILMNLSPVIDMLLGFLSSIFG